MKYVEKTLWVRSSEWGVYVYVAILQRFEILQEDGWVSEISLKEETV